jgi:hypothetical protein
VTRRTIVSYLAFAVPMVLGCMEPDRARVIGTLHIQRAERIAGVVLPSRVVAGQAFAASVYTVGNSRCTRPDGQEVAVAGRLVRFVPFDEVPVEPRTVCTRDLKAFLHRAEVRLEEPGPATLRAVGYFGSVDDRVLDSVDVPFLVEP